MGSGIYPAWRSGERHSMNLVERVAATEAVIARYRAKPFDWATRATCIHLARAQARAMGHKPPSIPDFRSPLGARTALRSTGHETLEALLDSLFVRIAPAAMLVGDLALLEGEPPFDAIVINAGGAAFGWHEETPGRGIMPVKVERFKAAWRL